MKNTLLRLVTLALALLMAFSLFACGGNSGDSDKKDSEEYFDIEGDDTKSDDTSKDDSSNSGEKAPVDVKITPVNGDLTWSQLLAQMPKQLKGTTITMFSWNDAKEVTGAEKVIADFQKQTGIKVKWVNGGYDNYDTKLAALINSGDSPDVFRYYSPNIHRMSLAQDITKATGFDFKAATWDQDVVKAYTVKGKIYGVNLKNTFNQQPSLMVYNKSVIKKQKLKDPYTLWKQGKWNWDTFTEICNEFKEDTGLSPWMTYCHLDYYRFSGQDFIKFDGNKFTSNLSDPGLISSIQKMANYRTDGFTEKAVRERDKIEKGQTLFYDDSIIACRKSSPYYKDLKASNNLGAVPIPAISGQSYYQEYKELEAYGIAKGAKNPLAAAYFLRFYLDANNYDAKTFFASEQLLEVYKSCRAQKNVYCSHDFQLIQNVYEGMTAFIMHGGTAAQVKNKLDELAPTINKIVNKANEALSKFD